MLTNLPVCKASDRNECAFGFRSQLEDAEHYDVTKKVLQSSIPY